MLVTSATALLCGVGFTTACGDDETNPIVAAGAGGGAGSAGSSGGGGEAGSAGSAGTGGSGGQQNAGGTTGVIEVLSSDQALRQPTTAAFRGDVAWVVNGQLGALFTPGATPVLPFNLVSIPITGGLGTASVALPGDAFYPEGIASAPDGTLYVGSINLGTVVRVPAGSTTADAAPFVTDAVTTRGVVGLAVDSERGLLWFCDSGLAAPGGDLVGVDLDDGTETVRHAMPDPGASADPDAGVDGGAQPVVDAGADAGDAAPPGPPPPATFCNDVIVDANDNILATDSSGRIFRVPAANALTPDSAEVWLEDARIAPPFPGGFGVNGLDIVGGQLIVANGGLLAIDPTSNNPASTIRPISLLLDGAAATLCGADGLETVPNSSNEIIVVENGFCDPQNDRDRVVKITLDLGQ